MSKYLVKIRIRIALVNLLIAMSLGAVLRYAFIADVSWLEFAFFRNAHSHVAILGWVYLALISYLNFSFLAPQEQKTKIYSLIFWGTQVSVIGMLVFFIQYGYTAPAIFFSTLQLLLSYLFAWRFLKDINKLKQQNNWSIKFVKAAIYFMLISTIALWGMGPIMALGLRASPIYKMAIEFYLHFQFNGWFIFGLVALFFKTLENNNITFNKTIATRFYSLLIISCFLTYALAVTWSKPAGFVFWMNSFGVGLQFVALIYFLKIFSAIKEKLKLLFYGWQLKIFQIFFFSFVTKVLIQSAIAMPFVAQAAYAFRDLVMGFLHLLLLGMVSHFLLAFSFYHKTLSVKTMLAKLGIGLFSLGFILSEVLLFSQGLLLWQAESGLNSYYELLFVASLLMPIGIALLLFGNLGKVITKGTTRF